MNVSEFDYHLPKVLIAQDPIEKRDHSRLLIVERKTNSFRDAFFYDLPALLPDKTVIVLNNTKVFKARLYGKFQSDERESEVFLLKKVGTNLWQCLTNPGKKFHPHKVMTFSPAIQNNAKQENILQAEVLNIQSDGSRLLQFNQEVEPLLDRYGHVPLPPYIKQEIHSLDRYQTIYAKLTGSVAAPTAGLHFTPEIFEALKKKNIEIAELTLHVGEGTFQPVKVEEVEQHTMHNETFTLSKETAEFLNRKKEEGYKILSVGTTTTRVLEHCTHEQGILTPESGHTNLFIYPGYKFKFVDMLLTNFHLPKSTLLMLVSAFAGKELVMKAYQHAIEEQYRFYSFGDAMLIM
jgi:S-adenosylmethionine:tRNA ribosyltransferase-isomerase